MKHDKIVKQVKKELLEKLEDMSLYSNGLKWIEEKLNEAYQMGIEDGMNKPIK